LKRLVKVLVFLTLAMVVFIPGMAMADLVGPPEAYWSVSGASINHTPVYPDTNIEIIGYQNLFRLTMSLTSIQAYDSSGPGSGTWSDGALAWHGTGWVTMSFNYYINGEPIDTTVPYDPTQTTFIRFGKDWYGVPELVPFEITSRDNVEGHVTQLFNLDTFSPNQALVIEAYASGGSVSARITNLSVEGTNSPVPLPPAVLLLGSGLFRLAAYRRKLKKG